MIALGFTGTRTLRALDVGLVMDDSRPRILDPDVRCVVTGAANGVDALVGRYAADLRPDIAHLVIVPWLLDHVDPWWAHREHIQQRTLTMAGSRAIRPPDIPGIYVGRMPEGSTYRDRDWAMVSASTTLRGYAAWPEDHPRSKRSGTWMTKRIADVRQVPIDLVILR